MIWLPNDIIIHVLDMLYNNIETSFVMEERHMLEDLTLKDGRYIEFVWSSTRQLSSNDNNIVFNQS